MRTPWRQAGLVLVGLVVLACSAGPVGAGSTGSTGPAAAGTVPSSSGGTVPTSFGDTGPSPSVGTAASSPGSASTAASPSNPAADPTRPTDVLVQLFEWSWPAIGRECTRHLGPEGYAYVQTSPPQEHILGPQWWTQYQPVSYRIDSRLGTRAEFQAMTAACHRAGVKVLADAVLNHMTGQDTPGRGFAGSSYSHDDYPGIYDRADFHHCGRNGNDDIVDYQDAFEVQNCELVNLADLDTGSAKVRATEAAYLKDLLSLGVDGFRVDAAKHISVTDLGAVLGTLPRGTVIVQEVIRGAGEPIQPEQYVALGRVQEFGFATADSDAFRKGDMSVLAQGFPIPGTVVDPDAAVSFVDNHDTERNGSTLGYADGAPHLLATAFTLGWDYGHPAVFSGYTFATSDEGPPAAASGRVRDAACGTTPWTCFHDDPAIAGMVGFHNVVGAAPLVHVTAKDAELQFGRGALGFVVLNDGDTPFSGSVATGLPAGTYCNVMAPTCATPVTVAADGSATVSVTARSGLAIDVAALG